MNSTLYWFDTEFMEDGNTIELLSIGIVCVDGREYYAESLDADWSHSNDWVQQHVLNYLNLEKHGRSRAEIAADILKFVNAGKYPPEFWGYYADYDWVALCQLYGRMVDLPSSWPKFCMDLKQLTVEKGNPKLPMQGGSEHHAMADARWNRDAYLWLLDYGWEEYN